MLLLVVCLGVPLTTLIYLPDVISCWRGVEFERKLGRADDISTLFDLIESVFSYPFRLYDALTLEPSSEIRGWRALLQDLLHGSPMPQGGKKPRALETKTKTVEENLGED
jgi:hypothetical protein